MSNFSTWDVFRNLLMSLPWTLILSAIAFIGGGALGLLLLVLRVMKPKSLGRVIVWYVQLFQGTPLLMQLFLTYFGMALFGMPTTPLFAATLCLILYASAYLTETWHGCVVSIPVGQWEASASLALTFHEQLRHVIVPQALRLSIAPTVGLLVQIIKNTALASVIGFVELTRTGQIITNVTYKPFFVYGVVALLYFAICFPCSLYARRLERKTEILY
ncbi:amino acid ABC transporter permease [Paralcaligenes sp. KSB-10]|uniref:amino acid ABC transporter permease n=1 Tax=Paralcaligenes sp. KSB-10 TaxID=2901142 RepID=UPI001E46FD26|nr:amino acid ABC transporter permease [Paralcaligenes sp. KSB-10]UHL63152.1 amino acid ABC transporter permease [Paralcaligenes sp. KSB-10]